MNRPLILTIGYINQIGIQTGKRLYWHWHRRKSCRYEQRTAMTTTVALLNQKGGAGKTTLATHIAKGLQINGGKVLLIDSDPQGSARDWHAASDGNSLPVVGIDRPTLDKDIPAIADGYNWIIIDGAPQAQDLAVSAIKAADLILIPVQPSPYDVWATSDLVDLIQQRQQITDGKPPAAFLISRQIQNTRLAADVREALDSYGLPILASCTSQRVAYANSATTGSTVMETNPGSAAATEIQNIITEMETLTHG